MNKTLKSVLAGGVSVLAVNAAQAANFNVPEGDLRAALNAYATQALIPLIVSDEDIKNTQSRGVHGEFAADVALARILAGTGFSPHRTPSGAILVVRDHVAQPQKSGHEQLAQLAQAAPERAASNVETVVVTSSKIKGDIQTVPIAITALSQEQLTSRQIAGGPDLVKEVPNLTFSKTNFTGYNIEIRGIGTQAISVTTDPAVAVAFNDTPFIRNHFFEQEFFDVAQVEVLRGPQGTLYGRNATAGVVNVVSAKPTDQFEAMLSADWGNYTNRRYEGMINLPLADDRLDLRIAGEWTKRDGYTFNQTTDQPIDGRDLWSVRATLGWKPASNIQTYLIWEHFSESDDRLRSGKQLCHTDPGISDFDINGTIIHAKAPINQNDLPFALTSATFSQGCLPASLYAPESFEVPNGFSLPFISGATFEGFINTSKDPYAETVQSRNLRNIQSALEPRYLAKNDTLEFNASWTITPALTLFSDTGYNNDFLWSTEDYNRFNTTPGIFNPNDDPRTPISADGTFCDPQLGCSNRLVVQDLSTERAWQFSQEFRLASSFSGPFNFSAGGNFLHYETNEFYYVFSNTFTMISLDNICGDPNGNFADATLTTTLYCMPNGREYNDPQVGGGIPTESPQYVDPNPITSLDNAGHNYFVSKNPYVLNSYAGFGEAYYDVTKELKLTAGIRWTDDEKHFVEFPSELLAHGYGYKSTGDTDQKWNKWTGRFVANWSPKLDFTDQSMFYASYAHGYKAGGANPPGAVLLQYTNEIKFPIHPLTFKPEFIDAYELGTKNTMMDGGLTLNGDVFFYNYTGYQISEIVDRTSINLNFDATVKGAELEATWEPLAGLKFSFAGGYEDTRIKNGQSAIDLMDRTAGTPGWVVMKPWAGQASNCVFPDYVAAALVARYGDDNGQGNYGPQACAFAYNANLDPVTTNPYQSGSYPITITGPNNPPLVYPGYDPTTAPNNGEGFEKPVGGNELPNAPHFTVSLTGDYTMPVSANWAATLHADFYWQSQSWARVFNDRPYDKIRGYSNVNTALILTDASGWQVMGYVKNIFDTTAITGDFLNSDDSGLTTNIFLTDPRLYGIRVTKHFDGDGGGLGIFGGDDAGRPTLWLQLGGNLPMLDARQKPYVPPFESKFEGDLPTPVDIQKTPKLGLDWEGSLTYQPDGSDWVLKAGIRYGRTARNNSVHRSVPESITYVYFSPNFHYQLNCAAYPSYCAGAAFNHKFIDAKNIESEHHMMLDFTLGKDVGIGSVAGTLSAGVRVAQFTSGNTGEINADPNYYFGPKAYIQGKYHQVFDAKIHEKRSFHGIGPQLRWDASNALFGDSGSGQIALDWGANAGLLFGRQASEGFHQTWHCTVHKVAIFFAGCQPPSLSDPETFARSKNVTVPNLGGYAGVSLNYKHARLKLGYRADWFFGAIDGGQAVRKEVDRGFYGPYASISIGLP